MFWMVTSMFLSKHFYWELRRQLVAMSDPADSAKIYTRQFWLLCLSSLLFFASFTMLIPELPAYLTSLGGATAQGADYLPVYAYRYDFETVQRQACR